MKRNLRVLCLGALAFVARAQTATTGQIEGFVTDPSGAAISSARISLTGAIGAERHLTTDDFGYYVFPMLSPGVYQVEIEKAGFANAVIQGISVRITETTECNRRLDLARRKETITVTSDAAAIQTETPARGEVVQSGAVRQLPLATRNFQQLLTLTPGTAGAIPNSSELGRGDAVFNVNGQRTVSNSIVLNGVDASSAGTGSTPNLAVPATDSLQEFIVQTSFYDASQGRNAGSVVAAVTKSGTDTFHGGLYEFLRNNDLDANNFFLNRAAIARPADKRNEFGGTLGGPLRKHRMWFFVSYQGTREVNGTSIENSVGTVFVPGDLSNDRSTGTLTALASTYGVPPCNSAAGAAGCLSPTALALLQAKLPNGAFVIPSAPRPAPLPVSGGPAPAVPVPVVALSRFREDQFNANVEDQISAADRISAKFFWANNPQTQGLFNSFGVGNDLPTQGFGATGAFNQRLLSIDDTHVFKPEILSEFRFGYSTISTTATPQEPFTAQAVGITSPLGNIFSGMPEISVTNMFDLGASPFSDNHAKEENYTVGETVAWNKGTHNITFGGEYKHHEVVPEFNLFTRGEIVFPGLSGDPFKDFLGGFFDLAGLSIIGSGVNSLDAQSYDLAGFANDVWRLNERLSVNFGVRYEYFSPYVEAQGRAVSFDPVRFAPAKIPGLPPGYNVALTAGLVQASNAANPLPGVPTVQSSLVPPDKNNFAPRIGFAWQPFSSISRPFVVRGGYGVYYDKLSSRFIDEQLLDFPYYTLAQAFGTPIATPFVQVPQPASFPLKFDNRALFPFGGPPALMPAPVLGGVQPVPANGIFPDLHDFRTPYVHEYSLGIQTELAKNWILDISYVGSLGRKLLRTIDLNQPFAPATGAPGPLSPALSTLLVAGFGVHLVQTSANSSYNALQASFSKRLSNGLQYIAAYTYSHSIDEYSGDPSGTNDVSVVPGNQLYLNNRGSSDFDRRQRFVLSGIYDLPRPRNAGRFASTVLSGWEIAGIITLQSGTPFSVLTDNTAFIQARADTNSAVPNCNANLSGSITNRLNDFFNVGCFVPATAPGDFGTTGRNILVGPAQKNADLSAIRLFPLAERSALELRAEFFNAFNHASFANPVNILANANVGAIVRTTTGPRIVQFALKFNF